MKGRLSLIGVVLAVILTVMVGALSGCAALTGGEGCGCPCCEDR